jgi:NarL family two-component system response regulator LiaR
MAQVDDVEFVAEAPSADEAIRLVSLHRIDVVLMDLMMPGTDAVDGIRQIRSARPGTQVIVLTSFSDEVRVHAALDAGAIGYLLKDVLRDDLLRAIRSAVHGQPTLHPVAQKHLMTRMRKAEAQSIVTTLTPRELSILERIGLGLNNRSIASGLGLTYGTIKGNVSRILEKLGVEDRTQAALIAVREGLVQPGQVAHQ